MGWGGLMSKPMSDSGKGSFRRNEDTQKVHDNWDLIWGKKKEQQTMKKLKDFTEDDFNEALGVEAESDDEDEWTCDCCGGPMYRQAHWSYGQCDDCGARQELVDDEYI
jgi:rubrerythrin